MREVAVIGVSMIKFGRYPDKDVSQLGAQAGHEALKDAGVQMKDIESGTADPFPRQGFCNEKMCQFYQECQEWKYGGLA